MDNDHRRRDRGELNDHELGCSAEHFRDQRTEPFDHLVPVGHDPGELFSGFIQSLSKLLRRSAKARHVVVGTFCRNGDSE